jgi:site-specific DNA-cytosine methylase
MNVLAVFGGIGSMSYAAEKEGFKVLGNIEPRRFVTKKDWEANFPETFFSTELTSIDKYVGKVDLLVGHPSCGAFSGINWSGSQKTVEDVTDFVDSVNKVRPKYFIMDNLIPSIVMYDADTWSSLLQGQYNVFPMSVVNRYYGNCQERKRIYYVGWLKEISGFMPAGNEEPQNAKTTAEVIGDLLGLENQYSNHEEVDFREVNTAFTHVKGRGTKMTWAEVKEYLKDYPEGKVIQYIKENGQKGNRIGCKKVKWEGTAPTLSGANKDQFHPIRCTPLTDRENLRIMGFGDEFVLVNPKENNRRKQAVKACCVESVRHFVRQIKKFEETGSIGSCTGREYKVHQNILSGKLQFCRLNKEHDCTFCAVKNVCSRRER